MKRTNTPTSKTPNKNLDRLVEELGPDVVRHLHRAFTLTAAALYRRAVERAEAQLQQRQDS
jgi:hypothetical protein